MAKERHAPRATDWFFVSNETDGTCAIGDPTKREPIARAVNAKAATRICKAVNERDDLLAALKQLHELCKGVEPFNNAVTSRASVKDIRRVGKFLIAMDEADEAIARAEGRA